MRISLSMFFCLFLLLSFSIATETVHFNSTDSTHKPSSICSDNHGGIYVVFQEKLKDGRSNLYLKRYGELGQGLWNGEEKLIAKNVIINNNNLYMIANKQGEIFCYWQGYRPGSQASLIRVIKVDIDGNNTWNLNSISTFTTQIDQRFPRLICDNTGGCYLFWHGRRIFEAPGGVYMQHLDTAGKSLWSPENCIFKEAAYEVMIPTSLVDKKDNLILAWGDRRNDINGYPGQLDLFIQCIDKDGKILWKEQGNSLVTAIYDQKGLSLLEETNGRYLIAWEDYRVLNQIRIYMQEFDVDGKLSWNKDGIMVPNTDNFDDIKPQLLQNRKNGKIYLVSLAIPGGPYADLLKTEMIVSTDSGLSFSESQLTITNRISRTEENPGGASIYSVVMDDSGGITYLWAIDAMIGDELGRGAYLRYLSSNGWLTGKITLENAFPEKAHRVVKSFLASNNEVWIVWINWRNPFSGYNAQLFNPSNLVKSKKKK